MIANRKNATSLSKLNVCWRWFRFCKATVTRRKENVSSESLSHTLKSDHLKWGLFMGAQHETCHLLTRAHTSHKCMINQFLFPLLFFFWFLQLHLNIQLNFMWMCASFVFNTTHHQQNTHKKTKETKLVFRTNWHEIFSSKSEISSRVRAIFFSSFYFVLLWNFFGCYSLMLLSFLFCQLLFRCLFLHWCVHTVDVISIQSLVI